MKNTTTNSSLKPMYYIYHIPGRKIGVTKNLYNRVTLVQGYKEGEYEVLEESEDIDYISDREIQLQWKYGYKVDLIKYNELNCKPKQRKMRLNVTEQTTTFPYPVNKLKGNLQDNMGTEWEVNGKKVKLDLPLATWIIQNVKTSMFNHNRCYVYNKALLNNVANNKLVYEGVVELESTTNHSIYDDIRMWANNRGIYDKGDLKTQFCKLGEEFGELGRAIVKDDKDELIDAIGDMVVVLTNVAALAKSHFSSDITLESCVQSAYDVIKSRKGEMINGTFVKEETPTINSWCHQSVTRTL